MSICKRVLPRTGKVYWRLDYRDAAGVRRARSFATKAAAVAYEMQVRGELARGVHVADSASLTVAEAADIWLSSCEANKLEESTTRVYRNHVRKHIKPLLGEVKLSRLTAPVAQGFVERLAEDRNRATVVKVTNSLKSIVSEAVRRGLAATNPVREVRLPGSSRDEEEPEFPTAEEIKLLLECAAGSLRAFVHTAIFSGMRPSELRGLVWGNVDLKEGVVRVRQRADRLGKIGRPKSKTSRRDIPMGPHLLALLGELREKRQRALAGVADDAPVDLSLVKLPDDALVFPDADGKVEDHTTLYRRFGALQLSCGIAEPRLGDAGKPILGADGRPERRQRYGLHAMRHACASLLIAQGWQPKRIQVFMGHSTIKLTFDVYGHLFPDAKGDQKAMAKLEGSLLGQG
ncbi:MAG TPA: tyrosine-type recombinase/integrase [Stellaceae bacterium]|nr:tyrosine-type recombinase/integrase [Stellaceae bacterium]